MRALVRRLRRDPLTSTVNILGLAVALAAVLLMALFVRFESSFDNFFSDGDRLYRLTSSFRSPGMAPRQTGHVPNQITKIVSTDLPGVEAVTRAGGDSLTFKVKDVDLPISLLVADPNFLEVMDFKLLDGAPAATALAAPGSLVLTAGLAERMFGNEPAVGREVISKSERGSDRVLMVTAVMADVPRNSHLRFEAIVAEAGRDRAWASMADEIPSVWDSRVYLRLADGVDTVDFAAKIDEAFPRLTPGGSPEFDPKHDLFRVRDLHLTGDDQLSAGASDRGTLRMMAGIALLVLIVAVVNSTNLMTAQALRRGVEVGIRKTLGAGRWQLMREFMAESITVTTMATLLALALVEVMRHPFSDLMKRKDLSWSLLPSWEAAGLVLVVAIGAGILGGFYPALVMARWRPDDVFRGRGGPAGASWLRNILVVAQFAIAIALIVATTTVLRQVDHARDSTLAASPETLVTVSISFMRDPNPEPGEQPDWIPPTPAQMETLRSEILRGPGVIAVSTAGTGPLNRFASTTKLKPPGGSDEVQIYSVTADPDYLDVYGIPIIAGEGLAGRPRPNPDELARKAEDSKKRRAAREKLKADGLEPPELPAERRTEPAVLSESGARALGFVNPADAVGTLITGEFGVDYEVLGIAADATFGDARDPRRATIYSMERAAYWSHLIIRIAAGDPRPALDHIDALVKQTMPERFAQRKFLDELLEEAYAREIRQARIFAAFGGLAIVLACTGLFALTALAAARRTKEIGIRRVLGAGVGDIARLLVGEFAKPVLLANLIAWPAAWYLLSRWLEQYAVRVDLAPLVFLAAGLGVLLLACVTVGLHATRIALAPPSKALRSE